MFYGAGDEARTRYLHLGKVALYRMSYTRNGLDYNNTDFQNVKPKFYFFRNYFYGAVGASVETSVIGSVGSSVGGTYSPAASG